MLKNGKFNINKIRKMAKKAKEMSVEDKLKTLFRLQEVLSGIDEKRALRGELPLEVEDLEDEVAGLATRIEKITRDIDELNQAVVQKGEEIKLAKESVERYKDQLNSVRNNREYDVLTKEIEYQELEIQLCEKKIKEAQVKINERVQDRNRAQHNKDCLLYTSSEPTRPY